MKKVQIKTAVVTGALALTALIAARPAAAATHFSVGVGVGPAYGYYSAPPPAPGPNYYWTDGYYNPYGTWIAGYWAPRAYVAPRYYDRDDYRRYDRDDHRGHDRDDHGRRR